MEYLYHGSITEGITELEACSKSHDSEDNIVYLTGSIPYALFYIWDETHNHTPVKHVTGWVKNGIAFYEEQFPDQLKTFYKGVSGYLYYIPKNSDFSMAKERDHMYSSTKNVKIGHVVFVPDVYEELLKYEALGELKILRYNEQSEKRQQELIDMIRDFILQSNFFHDQPVQAEFMKRYFTKSWEKATQNK